MVLDAGTLRFVGDWSSRLSSAWRDETPIKMHSSKNFAADGTPEWTEEFARWISRRSERDDRPDDLEERSPRDLRGPYQNTPQRTRTTSAFRKLRRQAPQEFLVAYDLCVLFPPHLDDEMHDVFSAIAGRLNDRAERKGFPERYSIETVSILAFSAIHKISGRWL